MARVADIGPITVGTVLIAGLWGARASVTSTTSASDPVDAGDVSAHVDERGVSPKEAVDPCPGSGAVGVDAMAVTLFAQDYGVCVAFGDPAHALSRTKFRALELDGDFVPWALELTEELVTAFPPGLLQDTVTTVRFVRGLEDDRSDWSGFASCGGREMVVELTEDRQHDAVLRTMYHELAHLLHCTHPLDEAAFTVANELPYHGNHAVPDAEGLSRRDLRAAGYVSAYARTNEREDLAELFELAMSDPYKANQLAAKFPALDRKLDALERWADKLHPAWRLPTMDQPNR